MTTASFPVDLFNPGQVFACLGFLEAAEHLRGPASGGFDWSGQSRFTLATPGDEHPVETILTFLAGAEVQAMAPQGWQPSKGGADALWRADCFPASKPEEMNLPIRLSKGDREVFLGHWCDEAQPRDPFKLYSGNRSARMIAENMLRGSKDRGICSVATLFHDDPTGLVANPLGQVGPMGGSFNFDCRGGWLGLDVGYTLNDLKGPLKQNVMASPLVEFMAAWGLEHARPVKISPRVYRYGVWTGLLPPLLARAALGAQGGTLFTEVS